MILTYIALPIPRHDHGVCDSTMDLDVGFRFQISGNVMMIEVMKVQGEEISVSLIVPSC